jgi:hypothetical protein
MDRDRSGPGSTMPAADDAHDGSATSGAAGQRVITVLGMHRSGTSSLVGSLEAAGLPLGEVRATGGVSNEKGHREPAELISLHEDVLITNGGAWHLPPRAVSWTRAQRRRRDAFIADRADLRMWGWKEPRTLLVLEGWLEAIPHLEMVGTFRHPAAVARSLQRRHGSEDASMWLRLWLAYDRRLLQLVRERGLPVIDFDLPDAAYQARLRAIIVGLGLEPPVDEAAFFDPSLRSSPGPRPSDLRVPDEVARVHEELRAIAREQAGEGASAAP